MPSGRGYAFLAGVLLLTANLYWFSFKLTAQPWAKSTSSSCAPCGIRELVPTGENLTQMIILVLSGAGLREQRDKQRAACFPLYKAASVPHYFVVGVPSFDNRQVDTHQQGQLATEKEINVSKMLLEEHRRFADILVTPNRDHYRDLNEKMLGVLRFGVEQGAKYIVKVDDDYCVNINATKEMFQKHETEHPESELYGGYYYFQGTEYESMKGPHNETAGFMSGHVFTISRNLSKMIVGDDWVPNVLRAAYGTSSDDANTGKMVARASELHNISVNVVVAPMKECSLDRELSISELKRRCHKRTLDEDGKRELDQDKDGVKHELAEDEDVEGKHEHVSCGNHDAQNCAECPQGHGSAWCNGECKWLEKEESCVKAR